MIDSLSRFNINADGVVRLATDTRYALWFNMEGLTVGVRVYQPNNPAQFTFDINFLFSNEKK